MRITAVQPQPFIVKYLFVLLLFLFWILPSYNQSLYTTLYLNEERDVRAGIPKQITEWQTFYNPSGTTEAKKHITQYDRFGLPASITNFNEEGKISTISTYKYDSVKRVVIERNLSELNVRFPTNRVRTVYYYEEARSPVKIEQMDLNGTVVTQIFIKNDSMGLPIEQLLYEPVGNLVGIETASYDLANNMATISVANSQGRILSTDSHKISFLNAYKFKHPEVSYNDKGDVLLSQSKWRDGTIHYREYEYIYDKTGNWIEQKAFEVFYKSNGKKKRKLQSVFKREILYWSN